MHSLLTSTLAYREKGFLVINISTFKIDLSWEKILDHKSGARLESISARLES